nr:MAG: hypothetical protein [Crogonang virus 57]
MPQHFVDAVAYAYRTELPATRAEWLTRWPATKQAAIIRSEHDDPIVRGRVKPTIKRECSHKAPTKPRLIQAYPNLHTQCEFAVEHASFQKALFFAAGSNETRPGYQIFPGIYIAGTSGWTAQQLSTWADDHSGLTLYERDGERWDSTMQYAHHALKWRVMRACDPRFASSVEEDYVVRGRFSSPHGNVDYTSRGAVKSGHNDTTSGNTLVNLLIAANALHDLGLRGSIIAIGDDLLAAVAGVPDLAAIARRETAYGILPTFERRAGFEQATYASGTWLVDGSRHVYVPLLGRLLARQWWTTSPPPARGFALRRHGIACGMLARLSGIPLYDDFYRPHLLPRAHASSALLVDDPNRFRPSGATDVSGFDFYGALSSRYSLPVVVLQRCALFLRALPLDPVFHHNIPYGLSQIIAHDAPGASVGDDARAILLAQGFS